MKMKILIKDIVEAFVLSFSNFRKPELEVIETTDGDVYKSLNQLEESYEATVFSKKLFVALHLFFLLFGVLLMSLSSLFCIVCYAASALFLILWRNRKSFQDVKSHFIQFTISSIRELEKAKIPGYHARQPGIYEDNF